MTNTLHKELSNEAYFSMETQMGLFDPLERYRVWKESVELSTQINISNIVSMSEGQEKLMRGEEAYVEITVFDN